MNRQNSANHNKLNTFLFVNIRYFDPQPIYQEKVIEFYTNDDLIVFRHLQPGETSTNSQEKIQKNRSQFLEQSLKNVQEIGDHKDDAEHT